jgi:Spy/CpxP family protein refolding chaperone
MWPARQPGEPKAGLLETPIDSGTGRTLRMKRILFVLACAMLATPIWAQNDAQPQEGPPPGEHRMRHGGMPNPDEQVKHLTKELKLSADQQTQLKQIFADQEKTREQERESMQNMSPEDRRAKFEQTRQEMDSKIEAILNDSQKKKFTEMRSKMMQHRPHGNANGQQPPPPPGN